MMRSWRWASVVCLLLVAGPESASQELFVMSYNIRYDNPEDGPDRWDERKAELVDMLAMLRPEIIGVQEALYHQISYLKKALPHYAYVGVGREDGKTEGEFCAILYDTTAVRNTYNTTFWLAEDPQTISLGWDADVVRICTYGHFDHIDSGRSFRVFNTHLDHAGPVARMRSAQLIKEIMGDDDSPVILTGDLNALPDEEPIRILTQHLNDTYEATESDHVGPSGTWNGFNPQANIVRRIDYILVRNFTTRSHVHLGLRRTNNRHLSDHLPVVTKIAFQ